MFRGKWAKVAVAAVVVLVLVIGFGYIRRRRIAALRDPFEGLVEYKAAVSALTSSVEASGQIEAGRRDLLYTQYSVSVKEVKARPGETVKKGQLVARYESSGLKEEIRQTATDIESAKAAAVRAAAGSMDLSMLASLGLAQSATRSEAELESSYAQLVDAQGRLTYKAPFDGVLARVEGLAGQNIAQTTAQNPLIELLSLDSWYVDVYVSEYDVNSIKLDMQASVDVAAAGETAGGKVAGMTLVPVRSGELVTYEVKIAIDGTHASFKPGMSADARISLSKKEGVLVIPYGIAYEKDGSYEVLVKGEDGLPVARKVKLGGEGDEGVEVLEGLAEGESVYLDTTPEDSSASTPGGLFNFRVRMTGGR
ncbi:MAG TPA: efflux RND transporter periplasmic adaptor subunit [Bacillota bacterium]|nr:MAG: Macrolide export protein MacA [Firmicutes bacterium ADurb.Bin153]HNV34860.1 efflux RND transporter periplasmic adaptor subunit [Bacillota bacterium]